jgi:hypothetical protein
VVYGLLFVVLLFGTRCFPQVQAMAKSKYISQAKDRWLFVVYGLLFMVPSFGTSYLQQGPENAKGKGYVVCCLWFVVCGSFIRDSLLFVEILAFSLHYS